jgi:hypothetical protein
MDKLWKVRRRLKVDLADEHRIWVLGGGETAVETALRYRMSIPAQVCMWRC